LINPVLGYVITSGHLYNSNRHKHYIVGVASLPAAFRDKGARAKLLIKRRIYKPYSSYIF